MKNLDYYNRLMGSPKSAGDTYLSLVQRGISGGIIARQDIDVIGQFPGITEISISGLRQDTFEYFIENYGRQFKAILFWKCPLVADLELLASLNTVEYIVCFWNQRAEKLWDFSKTTSLKGFWFDDFTRMHDIFQIAKSPSLEELHFGDVIWNKYILNTLEPLEKCEPLRHLSFSAKKILDGGIEPLAHLKNLEQLSFPSNMFTTKQVAWLKAHLPDSITSKMLNAYWTLEKPLSFSGKNKDTVIVGKGKPILDSVQDKARIKKHVEAFNDMYLWYLANQQASPGDYQS
jgi:hypothetical protein